MTIIQMLVAMLPSAALVLASVPVIETEETGVDLPVAASGVVAEFPEIGLGVDRVVNKPDEFMFVPGEPYEELANLEVADDEAAATWEAPPPVIPPDELPELGEVVLVRYADGNVVHQGVSATCSVTATASTPYKQHNAVWARVTYYQSAGCSTIDQALREIQYRYLLEWMPGASGTYNVVSGAGTIGWTFKTATCSSTKSMPYRSMVANRHKGYTAWQVIAVSSTVNLPCKVS